MGHPKAELKLDHGLFMFCCSSGLLYGLSACTAPSSDYYRHRPLLTASEININHSREKSKQCFYLLVQALSGIKYPNCSQISKIDLQRKDLKHFPQRHLYLFFVFPKKEFAIGYSQSLLHRLNKKFWGEGGG